MIYNCDMCSMPIYETDAKNLQPKVYRRSIIYLGTNVCHICINDMNKNKEIMEVYP